MVIVHPIKTNTLIRSFNLGRVAGVEATSVCGRKEGGERDWGRRLGRKRRDPQEEGGRGEGGGWQKRPRNEGESQAPMWRSAWMRGLKRRSKRVPRGCLKALGSGLLPHWQREWDTHLG